MKQAISYLILHIYQESVLMNAKLVLNKKNIFVCDDHQIEIQEMFSPKVGETTGHEDPRETK